MFEDLFNGKFVKDESDKNKIVVAMVYSDDGRNQGQCHYYRNQSLVEHLKSKNVDLNSLKIIPMENGRIFGSPINFNKVYYCKDITIDSYRKLKEKFDNLEEFNI
jgi:hypothetical protein